jgi:hypothetical protein
MHLLFKQLLADTRNLDTKIKKDQGILDTMYTLIQELSTAGYDQPNEPTHPETAQIYDYEREPHAATKWLNLAIQNAKLKETTPAPQVADYAEPPEDDRPPEIEGTEGATYKLPDGSMLVGQPPHTFLSADGRIFDYPAMTKRVFDKDGQGAPPEKMREKKSRTN